MGEWVPAPWSRRCAKLRHRTALDESEADKRLRKLAENLPCLQRQAVQKQAPVMEEVLHLYSRDGHRTP